MTKLKHLRPFFLQSSVQQLRSLTLSSRVLENVGGSDSDSNDPKKKKTSRPMFIPKAPLTIDDIDVPTTCCMSGCANCVWIEYAENLSKVLKDSPGEVQKLIMEKVEDPNMRSFLAMELRIRKLGE